MKSRDNEAADWFARMRGPDAGTHRAAFDAWRRDPANAEAYAQAEIDWLAVGGLAPEDRVIREAAPTPRSHARAWAMAGALLLALALGAGWYLRPGPADVQLADNDPAERERRLADGSRVMLMDGARIEAHFDDSARKVVLLSGRARFLVTHDARRPFSVVANGSETIALGTVFEVDLRAAQPRVTLIEGSVEVRALRGASIVRLAPGESAEVAKGEARRLPAVPAPVAGTMLDAQDLPLGTVIERAKRNGDMAIRLADPALAARRVTGRFDIADSAALSRKLAAALDLDVSTNGEGPILSARAQKRGE